jgi:hypothetical protein
VSVVQIPTSVTIISSLKGFQGISLTNYTTSALSAIASGSVLEVAGAFFHWTGDETPNASSWTAITTATSPYLQCVPSGSAGTQILTSSWTTSAPTWRTDMQGWYASAGSSTRIIGFAYKVGPTSQEGKELLGPLTASLGKLHHLPLGNTTTRILYGPTPPPTELNWTAAITGAGIVGIPAGALGIRAKGYLLTYATAAGIAELIVGFSDNNLNAPTLGTAHPTLLGRLKAANTADTVAPCFEMDIPLDSLKKFYAYTFETVNVFVGSCSLEVVAVGFYMGD